MSVGVCERVGVALSGRDRVGVALCDRVCVALCVRDGVGDSPLTTRADTDIGVDGGSVLALSLSPLPPLGVF